MSDGEQVDLARAFRVVLDALLEAAREDEAVCDALGVLQAWIGERFSDFETPFGEGVAAEEGEGTLGVALDGAQGGAEDAAQAEPLVERMIQIGGVRASEPILVKEAPGAAGGEVTASGVVEPSAPAVSFTSDSDLEGARQPGNDLGRIRERALLKSEACRWAVKRRRAESVGQDGDHDPDLRDRARSFTGCDFFALDRSRALPDDENLEQIACCFDVLARGVEVAQRCAENYGREEAPPEDLLSLLSEVQSALRVALEAADQQKDSEQFAMYSWLRDQAREHRILIPRHMRLTDPADPAEWFDLRERIDALDRRMTTAEEERRRKTALLDKLRYHILKLKDAREDERHQHWTSMAGVMRDWVVEGRPPSNRDLCDPLLPLIDDIPEGVEFEKPALLVLRAVDELSASLQDQRPAPARGRERTPEVLEAARLLRGRVVVMIGGQARRHSKRQLEEDLEFGELRWIATTAHRSLAPLEVEIAKPDVALVILAIRWSDHAKGDLKPCAERAGVPFLRLPGGYNPNRVAHEILSQVSGQLGR
ncbi:MAG: hypothetical protein CMJ84_00580 [Planctomycetes bacterium]|jgi:hypothetical protein|nr:hypothetical protein [Planctomycetota bacterium]